MPTDLFNKIIDDLSAIPNDHRFQIALCRINEPLLDKRLQHFHEVISEKLPSAVPQFWSNGTMLRKGAFEWMGEYKDSRLAISLNAIDEEDHQRLMGFGLKRVLPNLDYLHELAVSGRFPLQVKLVAPYENEDQANRFESYCEERWPLFDSSVRPFFVWAGEIDAGKEHQDAYDDFGNDLNGAKSFSCAQWFDLHILANGFVTKCCIDEAGFSQNPAYDTRTNNALDIFAQSRRLRKKLPDRSTVDGCEGCTHLG